MGPALFVILLISGAITGVAQQPEIVLCKANNIPLALPNETFAATIVKHGFSSFTIKDSSAAFTFQNRMRRSISGLAAVVDYMNEQDEVVTRLPYLAVTAKAKKFFHPPVHTESVNKLKKSIPPGGNARVWSESFVILTHCPVKARMSMVTVMYSDLSTQTWASSHWRVEPTLKHSPRYLELPLSLVQLGSDLLVSAELNAEGRVSGLRSLDREAPELLDLLTARMADWLFYPALDEGKPVSAKLTLLFRFHPEHSRREWAFETVQRERVPVPLSVVDLLLESPASQKWEVWYGPWPGGMFPLI